VKFPAATRLETERFLLVPVEPLSFSSATFHWTSDAQALSAMNWKAGGWTRWQWWRHIRRYSRKVHMSHGIWPKAEASRKPIGLHITTLDRGSGNATLSVMLGERDWWGRSVVLECRHAILDDCFDRLAAERATGNVNSRNFASIYNYQNLGFSREGVLRQFYPTAAGGRADQIVFGILASEWTARKRKPADE
jgi:RimJ/RimL family protein N-acetyltransferase